MLGVKFNSPVSEIVSLLQENGLLTVPAGDNVMRLLPPLIINEAEIIQACKILDETISRWVS